MNNTINDLRHEIKFENCLKDENNFFIKRNIAFFLEKKKNFILGDILFQDSKEFSYLNNFFADADIKNVPWRKPQMLHW